MVGTILPIVYRERKQNDGSVALFLHGLGYVVGAAFLGGLAGTVGNLVFRQMELTPTTLLILALTGFVSLMYSLREFGLLYVPIPQLERQVPHKWRLALPQRMMALAYGFALGVGITTRIPVGTFYVPLVWAILIGEPLLSATCMAAFGLGRTLPLLWAANGVASVSDCRHLARNLQSWEPLVHTTNGLALGIAGSCLVMANLSLR